MAKAKTSTTAPRAAAKAAAPERPAKRTSKTRAVAKPVVADKAPVSKLERGRFTMPAADFERIATLKTRTRELDRPCKKNELLRAGLLCLESLSGEALLAILDQLEPAKAAKKPALNGR